MNDKISKVIEEIFISLNLDKEFAIVSMSNKKEICDYQINSVFKIAKEMNCNPKEIGEKIVSRINEYKDFDKYFETVVFALPGFINIKVSNNLINNELNSLRNAEDFLIKKIFDKTCIVDYGGPNIAKPLHVGHIRPAIIGESIKRIMKAKGYDVIGDVHLGDYGLQIGQVIYGLSLENISLENITLEILERIYPKISKLCKENDEIKDICKNITKELQDGKEDYQILWKKICEISKKDIKRIYDYLGVSFELWFGESDSYPYMDKLVEYLESKNIVKLDEGAKIVEVKDENDSKELPPLLLQASNGAYLYATTDLATIYQRMKDYNPDLILYVVDERQRLHFQQVFRACYKSNLNKDTILEHNYFGTINGPDGKPFKTRSGDLLKLDDLISMTKEIFISRKEENQNMSEEDINIIVNSILKFADLQNNREKNYIFDINKFSDVSGKTGPYILYTALRIKKIFKNSEKKDNNISNNVYNIHDRNLRLKLLDFNNAFEHSVEERMPHYLAEYVYDLCVVTNTFYQNNNINNLEDERVKTDWINLLELTYKVIEFTLDLLTIEIPSKM